MRGNASFNLSHDDETALLITLTCYRKVAEVPRSGVKGLCVLRLLRVLLKSSHSLAMCLEDINATCKRAE